LRDAGKKANFGAVKICLFASKEHTKNQKMSGGGNLTTKTILPQIKDKRNQKNKCVSIKK